MLAPAAPPRPGRQKSGLGGSSGRGVRVGSRRRSRPVRRRCPSETIRCGQANPTQAVRVPPGRTLRSRSGTTGAGVRAAPSRLRQPRPARRHRPPGEPSGWCGSAGDVLPVAGRVEKDVPDGVQAGGLVQAAGRDRDRLQVGAIPEQPAAAPPAEASAGALELVPAEVGLIGDRELPARAGARAEPGRRGIDGRCCSGTRSRPAPGRRSGSARHHTGSHRSCTLMLLCSHPGSLVGIIRCQAPIIRAAMRRSSCTRLRASRAATRYDSASVG